MEKSITLTPKEGGISSSCVYVDYPDINVILLIVLPLVLLVAEGIVFAKDLSRRRRTDASGRTPLVMVILALAVVLVNIFAVSRAVALDVDFYLCGSSHAQSMMGLARIAWCLKLFAYGLIVPAIACACALVLSSRRGDVSGHTDKQNEKAK